MTNRRSIFKLFLVVCVVSLFVLFFASDTMSSSKYFEKTPTSKLKCDCSHLPFSNVETQHTRVNETRTTFEIQKHKNGKFGIIREVFVGKERPLQHDVSIVTHLDGTRLQNSIDLANSWEGPIQVTVFLPTRKIWNITVNTIKHIRSKEVNVRRFVTYHILFPLRKDYYSVKVKEEKKLKQNNNLEFLTFPLDETFKNGNVTIEKVLEEFSETNIKFALEGSTREHIAFYPQTIAMNVALSSCKTDYFLCIDSDLIPSEGLRKHFIAFAENHNLYALAKYHPPKARVGDIAHTKRAGNDVCYIHKDNEVRLPDMYVIPAFQTKKEYPIPRTLKSLRAAVEAKTAGRFFQDIDSSSYPQTNHWKWLRTSDGGNLLSCLYEVKYSRLYEPFVITRKGIPMYDERFSGWSEVESHHKLLLATLGYRFIVLQNGFLVHYGWKVASHVSEQKRHERDVHRGVWKDFNNDLKTL
uniref:beta-1,4-glucuronyltransferase 1-like n=1 Tax=Styela clava TaxID=7725 RepID=UPI00193970F4|nr:beta-1,4-glucuronyltransferase 1-like [Styela clava]